MCTCAVKGSVLYSIPDGRLFEPQEYLLVQGIPVRELLPEGSPHARHDPFTRPLAAIVGSAKLRQLCGNSMHLAQVGTCLLWALAGAAERAQLSGSYQDSHPLSSASSWAPLAAANGGAPADVPPAVACTKAASTQDSPASPGAPAEQPRRRIRRLVWKSPALGASGSVPSAPPKLPS